MADKSAELLLKVKTTGADAVDKLGESFDALKNFGVAAFAAISAVVVKSIMDYREQEEATNKLTQAMINNGIYSKQLAQDYELQATKLQKVSLFGDEQIINAQAIIQGYIGQTKVSEELTKATLNLAQAKKIDLATAAEMVGKSIGTNTNALARNGIEVSANASQTQKLAEVLQGIEGRYKGQAEAATEGLGVLQVMSNVMSDLFETIGERLAPVVELFANRMVELGRDTQQTTPIIDAFVFAIKAMAMGGAVVEGIFRAVSDVISINLGTAIGAVTQVLAGNFSQAFETIKTGAKDLVNVVPNAVSETYGRLKAIDDAFNVERQASQEKEIENLAESNARKSEVKAAFEAEEQSKKLAKDIEQQNIDLALLGASEENRARMQLQARIKAQENILKSTTDSHKKLAAQQEIFRLNEEQKQMVADENRKANFSDTLSTISTLSRSGNKNLAMIGKAAAIAQIAIATPVAISKALAAAPPPINFALAGVVGVAMAAQAAELAGVQLAEGGVVKARPGGIQATIGEGGQDEMVIPLDRAQEFGVGGGGGGNSITIVVNGGLLGSESEAYAFAIAVDKQLLKLRQNNESVAFDTGVV